MDKLIRKYRSYLAHPCDAVGLGLFRAVFGIILLMHVLVYRSPAILQEFYLSTDFYFSFPLFHWLHLPQPTPELLVWLTRVMIVSSIMLALGVLYRFAAGAYFVAFGYLFLLEKTYFNNHYYLILLFLFLLIITGADRFAALGPKLLGKAKERVVPYWHFFIFQILISLMFFFSGVAKLHPDWISGKVTQIIFAGADEWFIIFTALMGLIIDLSLGFMLMRRDKRKSGIFVMLCFAVFVKYMLNIGVFPYILIACSLLFIDPDYIRRILNVYRRRDRKLKFDEEEINASRQVSMPVFVFVIVFILIQVVVPLRHWIYPGAVNWNRFGDKFAWRMFAQENIGHIDFFVTDVLTGETIEVPRLLGINVATYMDMAQIPDMIIPYAGYLNQHYAKQGMYNPIVTVNALVSKNGRNFAMLIDPVKNLAHESVQKGKVSAVLLDGNDPANITAINGKDAGSFYSAAYQLAVIEHEGLIPGDHPDVARIQNLMDDFSTSRMVSPYQISNLVVDIKNELYSVHGRPFTAIEVLEKLGQQFPNVESLPSFDEAIEPFL